MKAHVPLFLRHYGSDKFRHLKIRGGTRAPVVFFFFFWLLKLKTLDQRLMFRTGPVVGVYHEGPCYS